MKDQAELIGVPNSLYEIHSPILNEPYQMEKRGVDYTIFAPRDHRFDFYSDILFTSQKLYKDHPQLWKF